ncbi:hypothetical protein BD770DRAFT_425582 [Pilaira anomala]|nr:hypothetical protein BD770DRAFT_425582 [Pilaira anomala]
MLWKEAEIPVINLTLYKQEDGTIKSTRDQIIKMCGDIDIHSQCYDRMKLFEDILISVRTTQSVHLERNNLLSIIRAHEGYGVLIVNAKQPRFLPSRLSLWHQITLTCMQQ